MAEAAAKAVERYSKLGLGESMCRIETYPLACKELSFILRLAYSKLPKNLQSLIFRDTLQAFHLLPQMQAQTAVSAANVLLQGADAALPKQKRVLASTQFKHAMVSHKRRYKAGQEEKGMDQLPLDVLVHIFSFLDLRSLVSTALVNRLWKTAASDNNLWQLQYVTFFGNLDSSSKVHVSQGRMVEKMKYRHLQEDLVSEVDVNWRGAFKRAYEGSSKKFITSSRGCCKHCNAIVFVSDMKCFNHQSGPNCRKHQIKPVSTQQIVEYIMDDSISFESSSDSDSDSEEVIVSKLWANPMRGSYNKPSLFWSNGKLSL